MKLGFYGPACTGDKAEFSCMTHGFPETEIATELSRSWPEDLEGEALFGTYGDCLALAERLAEQARAVVVFVLGKGEENRFLAQLSALVKCPIVGGTAAAGSIPSVERIHFAAGSSCEDPQAAVFVITDERYEFEADFCNIHAQILETVTLELESPRRVNRINGMPAAEFMKQKKAQLGLPETDCEHLTLSTMEHVNAHMNFRSGEQIGFGRDLEETMLLRYAEPAAVQERIEQFFRDEDAIVFGCAGLRGILDHCFQGGRLGAFLFGEIMTVNGRGEFGNLMLAKLRIRPRA